VGSPGSSSPLLSDTPVAGGPSSGTLAPGTGSLQSLCAGSPPSRMRTASRGSPPSGGRDSRQEGHRCPYHRSKVLASAGWRGPLRGWNTRSHMCEKCAYFMTEMDKTKALRIGEALPCAGTSSAPLLHYDGWRDVCDCAPQIVRIVSQSSSQQIRTNLQTSVRAPWLCGLVGQQRPILFP
jgi:hypothetical protein